MVRNTPVAIFMAATAILASNTLQPNYSLAGEKEGEIGGLKEWTTDQSVEDESKLDEAAKKQRKKAEKEDICIPVGEGENCW